ncbi:unnamed protein product [Microthlaspi erraticum]|uniref:F-box domain-containing protein n=1 Tax=Microthlaspi erraticum TaxID=1685480 RepID=A0A6D2KL16_9BRAS|nr:unnamed protein product [Microthlaspi erraticum]
MKGRGANRGLEVTTRRNEKERGVCGGRLMSLPYELVVDILGQLSRLDLIALATVSKVHGVAAGCHNFRRWRNRKGTLEPYMYVLMHMAPDPRPRWLVLHPVQRRLKPVHSVLYPAPVAGSCFVGTGAGIYTIGGLINGKPTSQVTFFDCINHKVYQVPPMKVARSGASASLIDDKLYVFGGAWDDGGADSSNWTEVFDIETGTWELLSVSTPKMPLKIQQSVMILEKEVYVVDEDGQHFSFTPSKGMLFVGSENKESNPKDVNDWFSLRHCSAVVPAGEYCGVSRVSRTGSKSRVWKSWSSVVVMISSNSASTLMRGLPSSGKRKPGLRSFGVPRFP